MSNLLIILSIAALGALTWSPSAALARPSLSDTPVTVTGTVTALKYAPRGEIDGFYLDKGTEVRFPKHWGGAVTQAIAVGAPVRVEGRQRIGRRGDAHVKAQVITNLNTNARIVIEAFVDISGQIANHTYSRSGRIDGFILSTGDEVRTPPHLAATIANTLPVGAAVQVVGVRKTGKYGEEYIKPDTITNRTTGAVLIIP